MKKQISFISAILCLVIIMLSGCNGTGSISWKVNYINLFSETEAEFIIIRSADASNDTIESANYVREYVKDALDITPNYKPDTVKHTDGKLEICVGRTNREGSESVYKRIANDTESNGLDYIIEKKGDFIHIIGMTDAALKSAVEFFCDEFLAGKQNTIADNYCYIYNDFPAEEDAFEINGSSDFSKYQIVTPKYNMSYLVGREVAEIDDNILTVNGVIVKQVTDAEKESNYEIVVDNTNRKNTPKTENSKQYRIKVEGAKIFIVGGSNEATAVAVKEFNQMILEGKKLDKNTDIKGDYDETVKKYNKYYSLTFNDEFDTLDKKIWHLNTGRFTNGTQAEIPLETYFTDSPNNVWVENGLLNMKSTKEGDKYYTVEMRSNDSVWFKYGIFEVSVKIRNTQGQVAATWLLGNHAKEYYSELDIYEASKNWAKCTPISWVSSSLSDKIASGVYYKGYNGSPKIDPETGDTYVRFENEDKGDYFHTYGVEWTKTTITFFVDGREFITIKTDLDERGQKTFNDYLQMILSHGGGSNTAGAGFPDETTDWENNYSVYDYVRLYQLPGQKLKYK